MEIREMRYRDGSKIYQIIFRQIVVGTIRPTGQHADITDNPIWGLYTAWGGRVQPELFEFTNPGRFTNAGFLNEYLPAMELSLLREYVAPTLPKEI